jgi:hypothetical protein
MKIYTENNINIQIDKIKRLVEPLQRSASTRLDSLDRRLGRKELYILRNKQTGKFLQDGPLSTSPTTVEMPNEAALVTGEQLENMNFDWTKTWAAVANNTPSSKEVFRKPNLQNKINQYNKSDIMSAIKALVQLGAANGITTITPYVLEVADESDIEDFIQKYLKTLELERIAKWLEENGKTPVVTAKIRTKKTITAQTTQTGQAENVPNPLNGKTNDQARKIVRNVIDKPSKGLFKDENWEGPRAILMALRNAGIDFTANGGEYKVSPNMKELWMGRQGTPPNSYKEWKLEINFVNAKGKPTVLYCTMTAHGAGTVEDPLSKYDMTFLVG